MTRIDGETYADLIFQSGENTLKTFKELALDAWTQEQDKRKQSDYKKRKRLAKKIEGEVDDLLPKDADDVEYERQLEDKQYEAVVVVKSDDGDLRFTHDDKDRLVLIGDCQACHGEALSRPVENIADLGQLLENFQAGSTHNCPINRS